MEEEGKEASAKKQESLCAEEGLMGPQGGRVRNHLASHFSRQETWPHQECHEAAGSFWTSQQMLQAGLGLGVLSDREEPGNQTSRVRIQDCVV